MTSYDDLLKEILTEPTLKAHQRAHATLVFSHAKQLESHHKRIGWFTFALVFLGLVQGGLGIISVLEADASHPAQPECSCSKNVSTVASPSQNPPQNNTDVNLIGD